jgi:hypothetical protein
MRSAVGFAPLREDLAVSPDRHSILDGQHGESNAPGLCFQCCGRRELVDEAGHQEWFHSLPDASDM